MGAMPLRCGYYLEPAGWGFSKLVARGRWDPWWDGMIGATMQKPFETMYQGTSIRYKSEWFYQCNPIYRFVVIAENRTFGPGRMGVINAYQQTQ
jgi:hypothetical protein